MTPDSARSPALSKGLVWHYTSPDGLSGILQNDVLWATSAAFMNDAHELTSGARALRKHFEKQRSSLDPAIVDEVEKQINDLSIDASSAYIVSASEDGDSLTLWRNYGKHSVSYAIGLDPSLPLLPLQTTDEEEHPNPPKGWGPTYEEVSDGHWAAIDEPDRPVAAHLGENGKPWIPVVYDREGRRKIVEENFQDIINSIKSRMPNKLIVRFNWLGDLLLIKARGFQDEREVRINYTLIAPDWKFLHFRNTTWGATPYIRLTAAPDGYDAQEVYWGSGKEYAKEAATLPIVHIRIGPTPYRKAAKKALRQLLDLQGYSHVKISASKIPYR